MIQRNTIAPLVAAAALLTAGGVQAFGLGEVARLSAIGEPLRVQIRLIGAEPDLDPRCLRLAPSHGGDLPWVRDARLAIVRNLTDAYLEVSSHRPANHPVLMLGVASGCDGSLRREYTLLLPPSSALTPTVTVDDSAPAVASPSPTAVEPANPSLLALAREAFPDDRSARRRFIAAARRQAPGLFPNSAALRAPIADLSRLDLDALASAARTPPKPRPAPKTPSKPRPATTPEPRHAKATPRPAPRASAPVATQPQPAAPSDRLVLFGGEAETRLRLSLSLSDPGRTGTTSEAERERLREEQRLVMALDDKIITQMELAARIRELEALQARLQTESQRLDSLLADQAPAKDPGPVAQMPPPAGSPPPPPEPQQQPQPAPPEATWPSLAAIAFAALLALAVLMLWWRRRRDREIDEAQTDEAFDFELPESQLPDDIDSLEPPEPAPVVDDDLGTAGPAMEVDFPLDDGLDDRGAAQPPAVDFAPLEWSPEADDLSARAAPPILEEDLAEEHESAVELADIMMSFGRVQGAAQTLADFIRHNPKQGVAPWIKLLDVYRAAGMRGEFDGLTRQLNATFNVKVVSWDEFDAVRMAAETLESMPHIVERLRSCWPTREAQVYLHTLLRDNRDGTRQGFPIAVIDEILCLLGMLNELVGPFRPRPGDFGSEDGEEGSAA
ncbi:MAG: hypothetical protein KDH20_14170 [Rhodocyclaceae bacterium]|nr:hypothetical protein [Rhodocyclaceae bacterium]